MQTTSVLNSEIDTAALLARIQELEQRIEKVENAIPKQRLSLIVCSNEFDRLMPAFILATGAASMGMEAHLFFTFWDLTALKKKPLYKGKKFVEKMLTFMMPSDIKDVRMSKMNMMGMGTAMFKAIIKKHNISTLPDLLKIAQDMNVKMIACEMTMSLMGVSRDEMISGIEFGGVATYLDSASDARITMFL